MSHLDNGFRSLNLKRFPETDDVNPLMAWEAADEYLLQQLDETEIRGPVLILNDAFGALGCAPVALLQCTDADACPVRHYVPGVARAHEVFVPIARLARLPCGSLRMKGQNW